MREVTTLFRLWDVAILGLILDTGAWHRRICIRGPHVHVLYKSHADRQLARAIMVVHD